MPFRTSPRSFALDPVYCGKGLPEGCCILVSLFEDGLHASTNSLVDGADDAIVPALHLIVHLKGGLTAVRDSPPLTASCIHRALI